MIECPDCRSIFPRPKRFHRNDKRREARLRRRIKSLESQLIDSRNSSDKIFRRYQYYKGEAQRLQLANEKLYKDLTSSQSIIRGLERSVASFRELWRTMGKILPNVSTSP